MNKAILIVICDFLVSSMLSMMTGMVPAHTGGTGVGLDAATTKALLENLNDRQKELEKQREQLRELMKKLGDKKYEEEYRRVVKELADIMFKMQDLKKFSDSNPKNTGELTKKQLQDALNRMKQTAIEEKLRHDDDTKSLDEAKQTIKQNNATIENLSKTTEQAVKTADKAIESERKAVKMATDAKNEAAKSRAEAEVAKKDAKKAQRELSNATNELKLLNGRVSTMDRNNSRLKQELAATASRLGVAERDLADNRGQKDALLRQNATLTAELNESKRANTQLQNTMRVAIRSKTETEKKLEVARAQVVEEQKKAIKNEVELAATKKTVETYEKIIRSDVFSSYRDGVGALTLDVTENAMIGKNISKFDLYLPIVSLGKRNLLLGHRAQFTTKSKNNLPFRKIQKLEYSFKSTGDADKKKLTGPLMICDVDTRLAALAVDGKNLRPLPPIFAADLQKRGLKNLYLFKANSFGRDSSELGGRCSLDFSGKRPMLCIHSATRGTGGEMLPEIGDFVLTGDGAFVGFVVAEETGSIGRKNSAMVTLFVSEADFDHVKMIPITPDTDNKYGKFEAEIQKFNK